jgi:hypothetical protein
MILLGMLKQTNQSLSHLDQIKQLINHLIRGNLIGQEVDQMIEGNQTIEETLTEIGTKEEITDLTEMITDIIIGGTNREETDKAVKRELRRVEGLEGRIIVQQWGDGKMRIICQTWRSLRSKSISHGRKRKRSKRWSQRYRKERSLWVRIERKGSGKEVIQRKAHRVDGFTISSIRRILNPGLLPGPESDVIEWI